MDDDEGFEHITESVPDGCLLLGFVEVVRFLRDDGVDVVTYRASDGTGDDLPLTEVLGMLRLTEDTVIKDRAASE